MSLLLTLKKIPILDFAGLRYYVVGFCHAILHLYTLQAILHYDDTILKRFFASWKHKTAEALTEAEHEVL